MQLCHPKRDIEIYKLKKKLSSSLFNDKVNCNGIGQPSYALFIFWYSNRTSLVNRYFFPKRFYCPYYFFYPFFDTFIAVELINNAKSKQDNAEFKALAKQALQFMRLKAAKVG